MADNPLDEGKQDDLRVNVHEPYEVEYCAQQNQTTPARVREVAGIVGSLRTDIADYIRTHDFRLSAKATKKAAQKIDRLTKKAPKKKPN